MSDLVPEDWEVLTIESVLDNIIDYRGKSPPKSEAGIPLITAKNVRKGYIDEEPREFIYENQFDTWMVRGTPRYGDVFITTEAPLGNIAKVPKYKFAIGQRLLALSPSADILSSDFLLQILQGEKFTEQLDLQSTGSTVAGIKQSTFRKMPLPIPPLPEQQKIAAILSSVDEVIEKTQAQINKLKDLKTGMMQELLSPREGQATNINNPQGESKNSLHHTEFKDSPLGRIPIGWEVESIEDVLDRIIDYRGKSPPKSEIGVPLITAKNIRQGFINKEPREYIYEEKFEAWMVRGIPRHGDIFITTEAPLGNIARVPKYKFAIGQRVLTLSPKVTVTSDYLFYVMQGTCFKEQLDLQSTGSTVAGIKQSTFRKIKLPIPPIFEQEYITKPLNALNQRIDTVSVKLDHYKNLKKALMQDLLTGKVRVKVEAA